MSFSKDFVWGTATASYQIEGAASEDGRKPSTWDMMARRKGAIFQGQSGDVACDHYHRYKEDVALMRQLGANAYRFSVSWPRVIPDGFGPVNVKGLDFYDTLVDELLAAGVDPWVTLYHWDHPLSLYHRGGWLNPETPKWFADYAAVVVHRIGDRVGNWFTLNEPQCFIGLGLSTGVHAPGDKLAMAGSSPRRPSLPDSPWSGDAGYPLSSSAHSSRRLCAGGFGRNAGDRFAGRYRSRPLAHVFRLR